MRHPTRMEFRAKTKINGETKMKHNLKTIAKCRDWTSQRIELIEFKKEIQQKIVDIEKANLIYNAKTMNKHLKEILGER